MLTYISELSVLLQDKFIEWVWQDNEISAYEFNHLNNILLNNDDESERHLSRFCHLWF